MTWTWRTQHAAQKSSRIRCLGDDGQHLPVTSVRPISPGGLRVILCMKFSRQSSFKDMADFKHALISKEQVLHSVEVSGSFDFMVEAEHRDLAAFQSMMDELAERYGHLIDHYEASFVCRRYLREDDSPSRRHLWVPTRSGLRRLEPNQIDKITAEGDYIRLHCGTASWLLHNTMRCVADQLGSTSFLQLNRSVIVRANFIDRLIHKSKRWTARLIDGTELQVAKSRSSRIVAQLKIDSSHGKARSPVPAQQNEMSTKVAENAV